MEIPPVHDPRSGSTSMRRARLPNKREALTCDLVVGNTNLVATVGFGSDGRPMEIFLSGGKSGSTMDFILGDAATTLSVSLQFGVPAAAMAKSVSRMPMDALGPAGRAASVIGAALDLLVSLDNDQGCAQS